MTTMQENGDDWKLATNFNYDSNFKIYRFEKCKNIAGAFISDIHRKGFDEKIPLISH